MSPTITSGPGAAESSSTTLVDRLKRSDPEAWRRFARIYGPLVIGWARRSGLQDSDAADVTQETFQAVAAHIRDFQSDGPGCSFRAWLWTIARRKVLDHFRERTRHPHAAGGSAARERMEEVPQQLPADHEAPEVADLVRRALGVMQGDFQQTTWRAFWRTAVDGQRAAAVAAELQISVAAVYMARSRVLARLREELSTP